MSLNLHVIIICSAVHMVPGQERGTVQEIAIGEFKCHGE